MARETTRATLSPPYTKLFSSHRKILVEKRSNEAEEIASETYSIKAMEIFDVSLEMSSGPTDRVTDFDCRAFSLFETANILDSKWRWGGFIRAEVPWVLI